MNRLTIRALACVVAMMSPIALFADDRATVRTHSLTVEQKLELLETIEITSAKELKTVPEESKDPSVERILKELDQFDSKRAVDT